MQNYFDKNGFYLSLKERFFLTEGIEDYVSWLNKNGKNITVEEVEEVLTLDPTYNFEKPDILGNYSKWLINKYLEDKTILSKSEEILNSLSLFNNFRKDMEIKDIMKFKKVEDLISAVSSFEGKSPRLSKRQVAKKDKEEGAVKLYEDDEWLLVIPKTLEASQKYGAGTRWCTVNERDFYYYTSTGDLYILINKEEDSYKYQLHKDGKNFMDSSDNIISLGELSRLDSELPFKLKDIISSVLNIKGFDSTWSSPKLVFYEYCRLFESWEILYDNFIYFFTDLRTEDGYLIKEEELENICKKIYYNSGEKDYFGSENDYFGSFETFLKSVSVRYKDILNLRNEIPFLDSIIETDYSLFDSIGLSDGYDDLRDNGEGNFGWYLDDFFSEKE